LFLQAAAGTQAGGIARGVAALGAVAPLGPLGAIPPALPAWHPYVAGRAEGCEHFFAGLISCVGQESNTVGHILAGFGMLCLCEGAYFATAA